MGWRPTQTWLFDRKLLTRLGNNDAKNMFLWIQPLSRISCPNPSNQIGSTLLKAAFLAVFRRATKKAKNCVSIWDWLTFYSAIKVSLMGLVYLTPFFLARKKVEHAWKAFLYDGQTVSVTRPDRYADRFERFMFGKVFVSLPMTESLRRLNAQTGRARPKLKLEKVFW